jgi:uncharacterized protein (DUF2336 family)
MSTPTSLLDELAEVLAAGSNARRIEMLSRITDLFLGSADSYSPDQIHLFDEVIAKLAAAIEAKARAKLAIRLAEVASAPPGVVRMLAFDDDIEVARPVLKNSERLDEKDLLVTASTKSQLHLAAISERKVLSEAVTDVLVTRGDRQVVQTVVRNTGARFSDAAFRLLVKRSSNDEGLAVQVGARHDLPRQHFLDLLEQASVSVRARLAAENPAARQALEGVLSEVIGGIQSETRKLSTNYAKATAEVEAMKRAGRLDEAELYRFAREGRFEQTAVALSLMGEVELDAVERALHDRNHDMALVIAKAAGLSTTAAKAVVLLKTAERGISAQSLDAALRTFEKLQLATARRVIAFHQTRTRPHVAARTASMPA